MTTPIKFGSYIVDLQSGEVRKNGSRIRLQEKPLRVLALLAERQGQLVTREELRKHLWPEDTFVDFETGLNTAVSKLRDALADNADDPRYIETIPRRGYRFVCAVDILPAPRRAEGTPIVETPNPGASNGNGKYLGALDFRPEPAHTNRRRSRRWKVLVPVVTIVLALSAAGYFDVYRKPKLTDKDTIVLADFANSTGDAVFDDALKTGLTISLQQSPFLNVLPNSEVTSTLQRMTLPVNTKLTPEITREVCRRAGSKVYVAGSIGSLGSEFVVGLKAVNCETGDTLAQEQVTATSKEKVLGALGNAATNLRGELGESLASVHKHDVPLYQLTTSSIEALRDYTLGARAYQRNGESCLPYMQQAIQLDPKFAMAYGFLGRYYLDMTEYLRGREYLTKAFELRDHASEFERTLITFDYYVAVTGELDKAQRALQEGATSYPHIYGATGFACSLFAYLGQFEKALDCARTALKRSPDALTWELNVASFAYELGRFDEAQQIANDAIKRGSDDQLGHLYLYSIAFQKNDTTAMAEQLKWFTGKPEETFGLNYASEIAGYEGRVTDLRELAWRSANSARRFDLRETAAFNLSLASIYDAAYGNSTQAKTTVSAALKMDPHNPDVEILAALVFAMSHEEARSNSLAEDLAKNFPVDTQVQLLWLPATRAQFALNHGNSAEALNQLQPALPLELAEAVHGDQCRLYIYIRGQAYLANGQGAPAAAEFQKLLDHPGLVDTCYTRALAHLGIARANALEAKALQGPDADAAHARAITAYRDFLTLWKDADPNIPVLKQAKTEYAKLQ